MSFSKMKYFLTFVLNLSIVSLSLSQTNNPSGGATNSHNTGSTGSGNTGGTGANNGDGSQGFNRGYSYNTGIQPYQTGYTYFQPFGDEANKQNANNAGAQNTNTNSGTQAAQAQPVAPVGYQPGFNAFSTGQQNGRPVPPVPGILHFGQGVPPPGAQAQPIQIQPIQLPNFDTSDFGLPNGDFLGGVGGGGGGGGQGGGGRGGGGGNNNYNNNNGFFSQPNNNNNNNNNEFGFPSASNGGGFGNTNNGYDGLPDDTSLASFANLGGGPLGGGIGGNNGGGGQTNDYNDDFGNLGDFGSATQNRGTFDILPDLNENGFFKRK